MEKLITALLLVVAVIHLLPVSGFLSLRQLQSLYEVDINGSDLEILMRHRAMLFFILGTFIAYAAFVPNLQPLAFIAATVSIGSFFYLAFSVKGYNSAIHRVVIADSVAALCLLSAIILYILL